jgi:hypothetical protein
LALLQGLNRRLQRVLPLVDLSSAAGWRAGAALRSIGHAVFYDLKIQLLEGALRATATATAPISLQLDHAKKTWSQDCGARDPATSQCVFAQAFHQSLGAAAAPFRNSERVFAVQFANEAGIDAGGVSREALTEIVADLHSPDLELFLLCPNGTHRVHGNMDAYLPNPAAASPLAMQMFEFVGKLMGVSLRTKATLPFNFPSFVWKALLGLDLDWGDLEVVFPWSSAPSYLSRSASFAAESVATARTGALCIIPFFLSSSQTAVSLVPLSLHSSFRCRH